MNFILCFTKYSKYSKYINIGSSSRKQEKRKIWITVSYSTHLHLSSLPSNDISLILFHSFNLRISYCVSQSIPCVFEYYNIGSSSKKTRKKRKKNRKYWKLQDTSTFKFTSIKWHFFIPFSLIQLKNYIHKKGTLNTLQPSRKKQQHTFVSLTNLNAFAVV